MKNDLNKGFTLIELLVVIAIIGILSSVVLSSLNSARTKGSVASGKSNLVNARSQAELFYDSNSNRYYGGSDFTNVCHASGSVGTPAIRGINPNVLAAARANDSSATVSVNNTDTVISTRGVCHATASGWASEVMLDDGTYFCVDANGFTRVHTATMIGGTAADVDCSS